MQNMSYSIRSPWLFQHLITNPCSKLWHDEIIPPSPLQSSILIHKLRAPPAEPHDSGILKQAWADASPRLTDWSFDRSVRTALNTLNIKHLFNTLIWTGTRKSEMHSIFSIVFHVNLLISSKMLKLTFPTTIWAPFSRCKYLSLSKLR